MAPLGSSKKKPTAHVFIDTSAFLRFFTFTGDDIDQLGKLKAAIDDGRLKLHVPRQLVDEFNRNREAKIKEALDGFKKSDLKSLPRLLAGYPEAKKYQDAVKAFLKVRDVLVSAAEKEAEAKELSADLLFVELCDRAGVHEMSDAILERALRRQQLGNPPGKADSALGDRLNWETLLAKIPKGNDLHVVSKDGHFASSLSGDARPHRFLADEWMEKKGGKLFLHPEVRIFFERLLQLEFESLKQEKKAAVESLESSYNFASTHAAVAQLHPMIEVLESDDVAALAKAAIDNTQINWIAQDDDVRDFYSKVLPPHLEKLEPDLRKQVTELFGLGPASAASTDEIPF